MVWTEVLSRHLNGETEKNYTERQSEKKNRGSGRGSNWARREYKSEVLPLEQTTSVGTNSGWLLGRVLRRFDTHLFRSILFYSIPGVHKYPGCLVIRANNPPHPWRLILIACSVRNLLQVTLLAPRIARRLLHFWKICGPAFNSTLLSGCFIIYRHCGRLSTCLHVALTFLCELKLSTTKTLPKFDVIGK